MSSGADISTLYREFTQALTDVLAEHAVGPASRGRLAQGLLLAPKCVRRAQDRRGLRRVVRRRGNQKNHKTVTGRAAS